MKHEACSLTGSFFSRSFRRTGNIVPGSEPYYMRLGCGVGMGTWKLGGVVTDGKIIHSSWCCEQRAVTPVR